MQQRAVFDAVLLKQASVGASRSRSTLSVVSEYEDRDTIESSARQLLESEGRKTRAGQLVRFVIADYYRRKRRRGARTTPVELLDGSSSNYDKKRYVELLTDVCNTVFRPFEKEVRVGINNF